MKIHLTEAKDLFKENYQDEKIMHMIINKYLIDGKNYIYYFKINLKCDQFWFRIQFKSISNKIIYEIK